MLNTPPEVIQEIVLFSVYRSQLLGPPTVLYALLLTCRTLYNILSNSSSLYANIFFFKFDSLAPIRRIGPDILDTSLELRHRFLALRCFYNRRFDDKYVPHALIVAYLMLLEDDGRNSAQLRWAGLPAFLDAFIQRGNILCVNRWPVDNVTNTLVVHLKSLLFSVWPKSAAHSLQAYAFAAFRYPLTNAPERHFYASPHDRAKSVTNTVHGPYPPARIAHIDVSHYGRSIRVQLPPVAVSALLSYLAEMSSFPLASVSPDVNLFDTRAQADALGIFGPTREDVNLANSRILYHEDLTFSRSHDADWVRAVQYLEPPPVPLLTAHKLGTLTGYWIGTSMFPGVYEYTDWMGGTVAPDSFDEHTSRRPLFFTLQEHFCHIPSLPVPPDNDKNGIVNAWLPPNCLFLESEGGINITDQLDTFQAFYETYQPESVFDDRSVLDVIVTGKTNAQHAAAWGGYRFLGRIRLSDGLVVLLREPINPEITGADKVLFRGYITNSRFVGRWRGQSNSDPAPLEVGFSFSRDE